MFSIYHPDNSNFEMSQNGLNYVGPNGEVFSLSKDTLSTILNDGSYINVISGILQYIGAGNSLRIAKNEAEFTQENGANVLMNGDFKVTTKDGSTAELSGSLFEVSFAEAHLTMSGNELTYEAENDNSINANDSGIEILTKGTAVFLEAAGDNSSGVIHTHNTELGWG
jgi:hypothetical protein